MECEPELAQEKWGTKLLNVAAAFTMLHIHLMMSSVQSNTARILAKLLLALCHSTSYLFDRPVASPQLVPPTVLGVRYDLPRYTRVPTRILARAYPSGQSPYLGYLPEHSALGTRVPRYMSRGYVEFVFYVPRSLICRVRSYLQV
jgi:hypothetical protein